MFDIYEIFSRIFIDISFRTEGEWIWADYIDGKTDRHQLVSILSVS